MSAPSSQNDQAENEAENPYDDTATQDQSADKKNELASQKVGDEKSFEELSEESNVGIVREFVDFLKYNKKWWLTPIIAVLLLVGVLILLTTSGAAPFLYTFW